MIASALYYNKSKNLEAEALHKALVAASGWFTDSFFLFIAIIIFGAIFAVGIVANVIIAKHMHNTLAVRNEFQSLFARKNALMLNLCYMDILVCAVSGPVTLFYVCNPAWFHFRYVCNVAIFLQGLPMAASTLSIMALSFDRIVLVRYPQAAMNWKNRRGYEIIYAVWLLTLIVTLPSLIYPNLTYGDPHFQQWLPGMSQTWERVYSSLFLIVVCLIPGLVMAVSHFTVGSTLYSTSIVAAAADGDIPLPKPIFTAAQHVILVASVVDNEDVPDTLPTSYELLRARLQGPADYGDGIPTSYNASRLKPRRKKNRKRIPVGIELINKDEEKKRTRLKKLKHHLTMKKYRVRVRRVSRVPPPRQGAQLKQNSLAIRIRMANILFIQVIIFACCWLPYVLSRLLIEFGPGKMDAYFLKSALPFCLLLGYAHSASNPIVYGCMNRQSVHFKFSAFDMVACDRNNFVRRWYRDLVRCYNDRYNSPESSAYEMRTYA